ncbi:alpha/beta hydrolase [Spongisporangium articulatum]|uniref:Alpha/beta hydrolase n=1 Tax=Spongisporangium articulatum TaxID=3362603 RepID=A0ABW8AU45_9ACTN
MASFLIVHGAGDRGRSWRPVGLELARRGHVVVAPDLPAGDESLTLPDYRDAAVRAFEDVARRPRPLVVVGHSFGAFTAPLVADALGADHLVLVNAMVPAPGERPDDWWSNVGYRSQGYTDPHDLYYNGVPRALADEALTHERAHPSSAAGAAPWPLPAWPDVATHAIVCAEDHVLAAALQREVCRDRLGVEPDELGGGHCAMLSHPVELADLLVGYVAQPT